MTSFEFRNNETVSTPALVVSQNPSAMQLHEYQPNVFRPCDYGFQEQYQGGILQTFMDHTQASHPQLLQLSEGSESAKPLQSKPKKARTFLTHEQVMEALDFKKMNGSAGRSDKVLSCELAERFGVCPKTILNIWSGRTWLRATFPLDASKAPLAHRLLKRPGRPKGSKDSKPRQKTSQSNAQVDHQLDNGVDIGDSPFSDRFYLYSEPRSRDGCDMSVWSNSQAEVGAFVPFENTLGVSHVVGATMRTAASIDGFEDALNMQLESDFLQPYGDGGAAQSAWAGLQCICSHTDKIPEEALASPSTHFSDPFHSDWPFWPPAARRNSSRCPWL